MKSQIVKIATNGREYTSVLSIISIEIGELIFSKILLKTNKASVGTKKHKIINKRALSVPNYK
uniref:Uncharacterized protein n=1 Tax=Clostridioides difficile TaxID=1496 RepID=A0A381ICK7_CLODI|nr:Uncharacterised protein [Clostridioides difficile]